MRGGREHAARDIDAYIRITGYSDGRKKKDSSYTYLVVSDDVRELIRCVFGDEEQFKFMINEQARVFAIVPDARGNTLTIAAKKNKSAKTRQMSIASARPKLKKMFGDDAIRIELSVEYYDNCVVFRPTGSVVCK